MLIAAHGDLAPVSPTIVGEINNPTGSTSAVDGFGAARRHLTTSNLSNGGAYDDTSGVSMTMAEYQAVMRWYEANGTYPSKTFKVALLDADAGRAKDGTYMREGSQYYVNNLMPKGPQGQYAMFAMMNANGASYPAYHIGTAHYLNNTTAGGVGPWHTFVTDTPSAANSLYPDSSGSIAANSRGDHGVRQRSQGRRDRRLRAAEREVQRHGQAGEPAPLGRRPGSAPGGLSAANGGPQLPETPTVPAYTATEQATYSPVHPAGTAPEAQILSTEDPAAAFWAAGVPGFSVGGMQDTNIVENPYPATTSDAIKATPVIGAMGGTSLQMGQGTASIAGGMSTSSAATAVGDTVVKVAAVTSFVAGQPFMIDTGQSLEVGQIKSVGTAGADRHRRHAERSAEVRARERCSVPCQRAPADRHDGRLGRAPQHVGLGRAARRPGRVAADGGAHPGPRAAGDVHGTARQQLEVRRRGSRSDGQRRLLRDVPGQPDRHQDRQLRRELRPWL